MSRILIVGGVAGGATAAARLRRLDESAEIVMFERTGYVSYANCGLPYYIGGVIVNKRALTLQTPQSFRARFNIDVRTHSEVTAIDRAAKTVTVRSLGDGTEYTERYDKLILAPGASAYIPQIPGADGPRVFTLRTVEDTFRIKDFIEKNRPVRAVIMGGGFIGLEMAENLTHAGIQTVLLQRRDQVLPPLDYDMACELHAHMREKGVDLRFRTTPERFTEKDGRLLVDLNGGETLECDMAVLAVGVRPDTALAKAAGLALGAKDAIVTDAHMRTSDPDIYAAGDAVEVRELVSGEQTVIPLAGPANKQGRIAADNICGIASVYKGSLGASICKLFDMTAASVGLNEKTAQAAGIRYDKTVNYSASHATYYPGAENMTVKTLFDPENGRVLGAQITGFSGVDKRIDVMAAAIRSGLTAADLTELELSYAPPFSSAKDPVNMAGFIIENVRAGIVKQYHWHDVAQLPRDGSVTLLDVREECELADGGFPGAVNIPLNQLRGRAGELPAGKPVYVNCYSGLRSYIACRMLTGMGFDCYNLSGGWRFYSFAMQNAKSAPGAECPCGVKL